MNRMNMRQRAELDMDVKQRERSLIRLLYTIQRWTFRVFLGCAAIMVVILIVGLIASQTPWGEALLYGVIPWKWILPGALVLAFAFIFSDTFLQSKEERWFQFYGSQIMATVSGYDPVQFRGPRWLRWLLGRSYEYYLHLEWQQPETGTVYNYHRRVRDQKHPTLNTRLPVVIDYDDPTYYLKEDYKDPSVKLLP
jgi:hypothetical protein